MTSSSDAQSIRVLLTKIGTLVFSGGIAALAIVQAGSFGCGPTSPQGSEDLGPAEKSAEEPSVGEAAAGAASEPGAKVEPAEPVDPASENRPQENKGAEESKLREAGAAGEGSEAALAGPDNVAEDAGNAGLPPRYFGGSKSDVDVWGLEPGGVGELGGFGFGVGVGVVEPAKNVREEDSKETKETKEQKKEQGKP